MKKLFVLILALMLTLSLAACGGNNTGSTGGNSPASTSAGTNGATGNNGGDNSTASSAGGTAVVDSGNYDPNWPSSWPSDVPKVEGTVKSSEPAAGNGTSVTVTVPGTSAVDHFGSALVAAGFTKLYDMDTGNGNRSISYSSDKYIITGSYLASDNLVTVGISVVS